MSFRSLRLGHFKCFRDSGEIRLAPLTLLFGKNNSGKSSVLQSLMLLRQSVGAPSYGPRLNLAGPLYDAGRFVDIVHMHAAKPHVEFTIDVDDGDSTTRVSLDFASDEPHPPLLSALDIESERRPAIRIRAGQRGGAYTIAIGKEEPRREKVANFSFPVGGLLPLIGDEPHGNGSNGARRDDRLAARRGLGELDRLLHGLRVVGPFRQSPLRRYEYTGAAQTVVDGMGRDVVNALIEAELARRVGGRGVDLVENVNRWLDRMARVRIELEQIDRGAKLFEVHLRDPSKSGDRWANFADVGFGIGQALPVFVEGLRTEEGNTFIVQEPEIHLHPDAQLAMADFLIDLARSGRQVLVETHSEHILLRVRRHVVEAAKRALTPEQVSILHVARGVTGASKVSEMSLDDMGELNDWPEGFLEEANEERLKLLEAIASRAESDDG